MRRRILAVVALIAVAAAVTLAVARPSPAGAPKRPNIVFVLTDDLSWNLVRYMPHVVGLERQGVTFSHYYVTDSLCCPSRSSIFGGKFPHDTHVFSNKGKDGGFRAFHRRGEESSTFATSLQAAGYRTAMMGKYLNGYMPLQPVNGKPLYVPPGWNEWDVAGNAYPEFNYVLNENGRAVNYGNSPQDYLVDVMAGKAVNFINGAASAKKPFAIELATFAPHKPYTPAPRYAAAFPGLAAPRTPAFDFANLNPPRWLSGHAPLTPPQVFDIDTSFRKRVQAVQAVDDMIARIESTLKARHLDKNTYIVFSSDNGYHMGEHRLLPGKMTAFDTDINVPLVIAGPGVPRGKTLAQIAENVDLRPTFSVLGGAHVPATVEGHSLVPLLRGGKQPAVWRNAALVEHHGPDFQKGDPDLPGPGSGNPRTYEALRDNHAVYVEYSDGERGYYDLTRDPYELNNVYSKLGSKQRARLHAQLVAMAACHGGSRCWAAQGGSGIRARPGSVARP